MTCQKLAYISGFESALRGSQGNRGKCPGDPWIDSCNGYNEVYLFFNWSNLYFL